MTAQQHWAVALFVLGVLAGPARGQTWQVVTPDGTTSATSPMPTSPSCPADRPHRVTVNLPSMRCTAMACIGKLHCDDAGHCERDITTSCNTCTQDTQTECLSDEEWRAAR